jgi:hypothetical protein
VCRFYKCGSCGCLCFELVFWCDVLKCIVLTLGVIVIIHMHIHIIILLLLYTILYSSSVLLPISSLPTPSFSFRSILIHINLSPLPHHSVLFLFRWGIHILIFPFQSSIPLSFTGILTPHVLSEWMVEVCRFDS